MEKTLTPSQRIALTYLPKTPPARWVASTKQAIVEAVEAGILTVDELGGRFGVTPEEFHAWADRLERYGAKGLRQGYVQAYPLSEKSA